MRRRMSDCELVLRKGDGSELSHRYDWKEFPAEARACACEVGWTGDSAGRSPGLIPFHFNMKDPFHSWRMWPLRESKHTVGSGIIQCQALPSAPVSEAS